LFKSFVRSTNGHSVKCHLHLQPSPCFLLDPSSQQAAQSGNLSPRPSTTRASPQYRLDITRQEQTSQPPGDSSDSLALALFLATDHTPQQIIPVSSRQHQVPSLQLSRPRLPTNPATRKPPSVPRSVNHNSSAGCCGMQK
jgi:hypothetical protein